MGCAVSELWHWPLFYPKAVLFVINNERWLDGVQVIEHGVSADVESGLVTRFKLF